MSVEEKKIENVSNAPNDTNSSSYLIAKAKFNSKADYFEHLSEVIYHDEIAQFYTPDVICDLVDFSPFSPRIEQVYQSNFYMNLPTFPTQDGQATVLSWAFSFNLAFGTKRKQWIETRWPHQLDSYQKSDRTKFGQLVMQSGPMSMVTNDFRYRATRMLPLFQHRLPDLEYTSYHLQAFYHITMQCTEQKIGNVPYHTMGLGYLADHLVTTPNLIDAYYPVLIYNAAGGQEATFGQYAEWVHMRFNQELCLVMVDRLHYMDAPVQYVTVAGAHAPNTRIVLDNLCMATDIDRRMMLYGFPAVVTDTSQNVNRSTVSIPQYDFWNHILDVASFNQSPIPHDYISVRDWGDTITHTNIGYLWNQAIIQRLEEYQGETHHFQFRENRQSFRWSYFQQTFDETIFSLFGTNWTSSYWVPYELISMLIDAPLMTPFYAQNDFDIARGLVFGSSSRLVAKRKEQDGRFYFIPSFISQILSNAPLGIFSSGSQAIPFAVSPFNQLMNYTGDFLPFVLFNDAMNQDWAILPIADIIHQYYQPNREIQNPALHPQDGLMVLFSDIRPQYGGRGWMNQITTTKEALNLTEFNHYGVKLFRGSH